MEFLLTYKPLHFAIGIYLLPVIVFLIAAGATYQNSQMRFSPRFDDGPDTSEIDKPEVFEKAKPNWFGSALIMLIVFIIILVFDFLLSFLNTNPA